MNCVLNCARVGKLSVQEWREYWSDSSDTQRRKELAAKVGIRLRDADIESLDTGTMRCCSTLDVYMLNLLAILPEFL